MGAAIAQTLTLLTLILAVASQGAAAQSAPTRLLGKSVMLKWTENREFVPAPGSSSGGAHSDTVEQRMTIYISALGRTFASMHREVQTSDGGSKAFQESKAPGEADESLEWTLAGSTLHGIRKLGKGDDVAVEHVTVPLASSSCSAKIAYAHPAGASELIVVGWTGRRYYLRNYRVSSSSCELAEGNKLAD